jgi:hypothetical protein
MNAKGFSMKSLALALAAAIAITSGVCAEQPPKKKPVGAQSLQERHAKITYQKRVEKVDAQGRKTYAVMVQECQWMLGVSGWFDNEGLNLTSIAPWSSVLRLTDRPGGQGRRYNLEVGDVIASVDGQPVTTSDDYFNALNGAANPRSVEIEIIDWRTGNRLTLYASAIKVRW